MLLACLLYQGDETAYSALNTHTCIHTHTVIAKMCSSYTLVLYAESGLEVSSSWVTLKLSQQRSRYLDIYYTASKIPFELHTLTVKS